MSKQTSTALSIDGLFSDDDGNPQHGDIASHPQVAMKSDSRSAGAAQPSRPAPVGTPIPPGWSASSITIHIGASGFTPSTSSVAPGGSVTLKYDPAGSTDVYTYYGGKSSAVFGGTCPYPATNAGATYTLKYGISGTITLEAGGTNGTINVGGGTACPPRDDEDDAGRPSGPSGPPHSRV